MVDGTRTTLRHWADDVMPRQPERMQLVDGQGRRMEPPPRWDSGDEGRRRRGGGGHKGMDVEEIWIHDTPARFPRAHSFCARGLFLDSFICLLFFCSFSKLLVSAFVCGSILHATTTTTPFTQRATNTPSPSRKACLFSASSSSDAFNGHSRRPACTSCHHPIGKKRRAAKTCSVFFYDCFPLCVCVWFGTYL